MRISDWSSDVCSSDLYRACASYDRTTWFRVPTDYDGEVLPIRHTPAADSVYYAYFPPYSGERHRNLVARCHTAARSRLDIGSASCRERVWLYVLISGVAVSVQKKNNNKTKHTT